MRAMLLGRENTVYLSYHGAQHLRRAVLIPEIIIIVNFYVILMMGLTVLISHLILTASLEASYSYYLHVGGKKTDTEKSDDLSKVPQPEYARVGTPTLAIRLQLVLVTHELSSQEAGSLESSEKAMKML